MNGELGELSVPKKPQRQIHWTWKEVAESRRQKNKIGEVYECAFMRVSFNGITT